MYSRETKHLIILKNAEDVPSLLLARNLGNFDYLVPKLKMLSWSFTFISFLTHVGFCFFSFSSFFLCLIK